MFAPGRRSSSVSSRRSATTAAAKAGTDPADRRSRFSTPFVECAGTRARRTRQSDRLGASSPGACQPLPTSERGDGKWKGRRTRSEEHTSELQSLMRISYAVFCLKKKKRQTCTITQTTTIYL